MGLTPPSTMTSLRMFCLPRKGRNCDIAKAVDDDADYWRLVNHEDGKARWKYATRWVQAGNTEYLVVSIYSGYYGPHNYHQVLS